MFRVKFETGGNMISKKCFKGYNFILFLVMLVTAFCVTGGYHSVYAASADVVISSGSVTQGGEIDVVVTITADSNIGAYDFYLEYDAEILEAVSGFDGGGGGRIQLMNYAQDTNGIKTVKVTVKFKAKAPGTTEIKYLALKDDNGVIDFDTVDNMSVSATNGSVTVNPPVQASSNNNLSSMTVAAVRADGSTYNVALTPGFSKDVTTYNIEVEEGVTKLVISANTEDSKASIKTEWANLDPGENTTKVIVTAENGERKQYTIYTKVPGTTENTTPPSDEPVTVNIGGTDYFIGDINDAVALPEGFEPFEYNYEGKTIIAARGLVKNLIVMYVTNGDGSAGSLYIYNEEKKTFYRMVNIQITQKMYTIVETPEDVVIPEGYSECTLNMGDDSFPAWRSNDSENLYLLYAMNWNGESGLYFYDSEEKQMLKYVELSAEAGVTISDYNSLLAENESLRAELSDVKSSGTDSEKTKLYKIISLGCGALSIVLLGILIVVLVTRTTEESDEDNGEDDEEDEPEEDFEEEAEENESEIKTEENETEAETEEAEEEKAEEETEEEKAEEESEEEGPEDIVLSEEQEDVLMGFEENIADEPEVNSESEDTATAEETEESENIKEARRTEEEIKNTEDDYVEYTVDLSFDENDKEEPDKKKKVAEILDDEKTSIAKDDIDMVIDELFDDLFGE